MRPLVVESLLDLVEVRSSRKQAKLRSPIGAQRGSRVTPKGRAYGDPKPKYSGSLLPAVIPQKPGLPNPNVLDKKPDSNRFIRNPVATTAQKNRIALRRSGAKDSGLTRSNPLARGGGGEDRGPNVKFTGPFSGDRSELGKKLSPQQGGGGKKDEREERPRIQCFRMPSATYGKDRVGS